MTPNLEAVDQVAVDLSELLTRLESDRDLLQVLYDTFADQSAKTMTNLKRACERDNFLDVQRHAYTLQGALATLSCLRAKACGARLEWAASRYDRDTVAMEMKRLEHELGIAYAVLERTCMEVAA
ncbi:MAG TPA: hypothetical protein VGN16_10630 [Acidobacteriaceae bacterium]|jgi:HPt (histidine-containing phosphotransfer) domain-containing protein